MNSVVLEAYLDGWSNICNSTTASIAAMLVGAHPEIRFSDLNSSNVHVGHEGIRGICKLATSIYLGSTIAYRDLLFDDQNWAIRWTLSGLHLDGTRFNCRGASAGMLAEDQRVIEHTDYWNRAGLQVRPVAS